MEVVSLKAEVSAISFGTNKEISEIHVCRLKSNNNDDISCFRDKTKYP